MAGMPKLEWPELPTSAYLFFCTHCFLSFCLMGAPGAPLFVLLAFMPGMSALRPLADLAALVGLESNAPIALAALLACTVAGSIIWTWIFMKVRARFSEE